jgi:major membrane immunogen (membrane-anchored lipoprotein)
MTNFTNITAGTTVALVASAGLPLANDGTESGFINGRVYIVAKDGLNDKGEMAVKSYDGKTFRLRTDRFIIAGHEDIMVFSGAAGFNIDAGSLIFAPTTAKSDGYLRTTDNAGFIVDVPLSLLIPFEEISDLVLESDKVLTMPAVAPQKIESRTFFKAGDVVVCICADNSKVSLTEGKIYEVVEENSASGFIKIIADSGKVAKVREGRFELADGHIEEKEKIEETLAELDEIIDELIDSLFDDEDVECEDCDGCTCHIVNGQVRYVTMTDNSAMPSGAIFNVGEDYIYKVLDSRVVDGNEELLVEGANGRKFWLNARRFV